ncbi:MAG: type II toxin-antitoxin system HicA family toxin [Patescibacteria group bacterium]
MPKLTIISGKKMIKFLERCGFEIVRIKGSHHFLKNASNGFITTVPVHNNEDLGMRMIKDILSDINMDRKEYEKLRKKRK